MESVEPDSDWFMEAEDLEVGSKAEELSRISSDKCTSCSDVDLDSAGPEEALATGVRTAKETQACHAELHSDPPQAVPCCQQAEL